MNSLYLSYIISDVRRKSAGFWLVVELPSFLHANSHVVFFKCLNLNFLDIRIHRSQSSCDARDSSKRPISSRHDFSCIRQRTGIKLDAKIRS